MKIKEDVKLTIKNLNIRIKAIEENVINDTVITNSIEENELEVKRFIERYRRKYYRARILIKKLQHQGSKEKLKELPQKAQS